MSYLVLARKWRPMDFADLVGQDHVARTLANAIASNRVAHAFLFTGVRGVGKTTSARIMAKALNCMRPPGTTTAGTDPGPTASPCLECAPCKEIALGTDVDVQEIDGASYNGIDEVRRLQDSLPYRPSRDRYKIIIVDEVHMLSQNAWNAFLKTLEEPPAHVKFIFATTEVHKVPVTILSRVQRFDFKLIGTQLIRSRLRFVLEKEGVRADDGALSIISREAAGSMRDAMSLLDQVIAWGDEGLTEDVVSKVLGVASRSVLHQLARALVEGQPAGCLAIVQALADQGHDMTHVARDLLGLLRDLVVAAVCPDPGTLLDTPEDERRDIVALAHDTSTDDLIRVHQAFSRGFDDVVRSSQPRASVEMLLVKLSRRPPLLPLNELVDRLMAVERRLGGAAPNVRAGTVPANARPPSGELQGDERPRSREPNAQRRSKDTSSDANDSEEPHPWGTNPRSAPADTTGLNSGALNVSPATKAHAPEVVCATVEAGAFPGERTPERIPPPIRETPEPVPGVPAARTAAPLPAHDSAELDVAAPSARSERPRALPSWAKRVVHSPESLTLYEQIVTRLKQTEPQLGALLEHAVPLEASPSSLVVAWEPGHPLAATASSAANVAHLIAAATEVLGSAPKVEHRLEFAEARSKVTLASTAAAARDAANRAAQGRARAHPLVREALEVLGAKIREVRLPD